MFFARKKLYETISNIVMFLIPIAVFLLLHRHVPAWAAATAAVMVLLASVWSGS